MTQYLSQWSLAVLLIRAFLWGVLLGAVYSVFGIRRAAFRKLRIPRILSALFLHLEDFLFCVTGAAGLSILYFATTGGVLRLMAVPLLGGGILLWRLTGGRLVEICTDGILRLLAAICRWIMARLLAPIGCAVRKIFLRMRASLMVRRERRYYRKLTRISQRVTLRYEAALAAACGAGSLPPPDGKWRTSPRRRAHHPKKSPRKIKRKESKRKESSK